MNFLSKIKLLFRVQKPAGELVDELKKVKSGYKTIAFWMTLLGSLAATAAALKGFLPPQAQLVVATALTLAYNVLRGAQKAESADVKGPFVSTEFWLTLFTELQKSVVVMQTGGVNSELLATLSTVAGVGLAVGQNLAARAPVGNGPVTEK